MPTSLQRVRWRGGSGPPPSPRGSPRLPSAWASRDPPPPCLPSRCYARSYYPPLVRRNVSPKDGMLCEDVKLLCISDRVEPMLHGPNLTSYAKEVEAVISCGDLPFAYLEYIVTFLGVPVYYVLGNHDPAPDGPEHPGGCTPLDGRVVDADGVVLAGLSGSRLYSGGPNQYTQPQMRRRAWAL